MCEIKEKLGMGWLPDYPDFRDFSMEHDELPTRLQKVKEEDSIKSMITKIGVAQPEKLSLPSSVDLRAWCSPIHNQGSLGSCTANAGVSLMEYCERKAFGRHIDASRLFLYKATRNMLHWTGDTGAFIRTTMGAMVLFGVPPEEFWAYVIADFDEEPTAFCYAFAQNFQALQYFRLDPPGIPKTLLLKRIKALLAAGLPSMFGFAVFSSYRQASNSGRIPFPCNRERILGGHAIAAVGYDDNLEITNRNCGLKTKGALLFQNSWGTGWGDNGYGFLPYDYVLKGLAIDWWALLKSEWVYTGKFKI